MWNTHINLTDTELDAIAEAGKVELSAEQRLDLKAEIETYTSFAEAERCAPAVGGSGRACVPTGEASSLTTLPRTT